MKVGHTLSCFIFVSLHGTIGLANAESSIHTGMDCSNSQCVDPCHNYTVLNDDWRSTNNTDIQVLHCDKNIDWQGWYRLFLGESGAHIPERCLDPNRCGTHAPLWITQPHPTQSGEILTRTVCSSWEGNCCKFESHIIHVKHCYGNYYVYKLVKPATCQLAYCAEVNITDPAVPFTTPAPTPKVSSPYQVHINVTTAVDNSTAVEGEVRLVNAGNDSCSGRVEIFHGGQWGAVCDDAWSLGEAQVVCRQLGCGRLLSIPTNAEFEQGKRHIWLDNVTCSGSETQLSECHHSGFGSHNCSHHEDAGVICEGSHPDFSLLLVVIIVVMVVLMLFSVLMLIYKRRTKTSVDLDRRRNSDHNQTEIALYENFCPVSRCDDSIYQSLDPTSSDQDQTYCSLTHSK
ncbi:scavenger receptor cysteine-rich type 1 protein M130-like [Astatotilapia calliptera]|uniref:scavenger receptor cysteine-rich type 1 protein M130-like n=1 Tax=Astatotilapia calliptera TaxID=8154 RepID=UPI000E3FBF1B|nr:scavenger receptor cysteine-rich type 1 protein M130-like [Astatotilapia calliptera]